jgi:murein endopeptidase
MRALLYKDIFLIIRVPGIPGNVFEIKLRMLDPPGSPDCRAEAVTGGEEGCRIPILEKFSRAAWRTRAVSLETDKTCLSEA